MLRTSLPFLPFDKKMPIACKLARYNLTLCPSFQRNSLFPLCLNKVLRFLSAHQGLGYLSLPVCPPLLVFASICLPVFSMFTKIYPGKSRKDITFCDLSTVATFQQQAKKFLCSSSKSFIYNKLMP